MSFCTKMNLRTTDHEPKSLSSRTNLQVLLLVLILEP